MNALLLKNFVSKLGKGRGRQVIAVAKTADLVIIMLDASKSLQQRYVLECVHFSEFYCINTLRNRALLERELEAVGIRVNQKKPNVYFKVIYDVLVFNNNQN